jgi:hypothetical protein
VAIGEQQFHNEANLLTRLTKIFPLYPIVVSIAQHQFFQSWVNTISTYKETSYKGLKIRTLSSEANSFVATKKETSNLSTGGPFITTNSLQLSNDAETNGFD